MLSLYHVHKIYTTNNKFVVSLSKKEFNQNLAISVLHPVVVIRCAICAFLLQNREETFFLQIR